MSRFLTLITSLVCGLLHAAPITWGPATAISTGSGNSSDVSTNGSVVEAYNGVGNDQIGTATNVIVNGVTFTPTTSLLNEDPKNGGSNDFSSTTNGGDASYDTLLSTLEYGGGDGVVTLTIGDGDGNTATTGVGLLTIGEDYEIQVWFSDTRNDRVMTFGDGNGGGLGNVVYLNDQYAIGTFTADASTQTLTLDSGNTGSGSPNFGQSHITAYQIRKAVTGPPPPPTTPANVTISNGNNLVFLDWDDYGQTGFLEFRIKRSDSMGGPYEQIGTSAASNFTDNTAVNGTTYYYIITAANTASLESSPSSEEEGVPAPTTEPPNFLFIIADDMDTYALNAYRTSEPAEINGAGQPYPINTPNLDRLASEGMLFHQARIMGSWAGAVCTGSRTCIMTGRNTWESQADHGGSGSAANTFPGIFNQGARSGMTALPHATYRTCKNGNSYGTANATFTIVNDSTKRGNTTNSGSEWHADRSLEHIDHWRSTHRPLGKPFMMYLGFSHPHDERNAQPSLATFYNCVNTTSPGSVSLNPNAPPLPINHLPIVEADGTPANYPFHPFNHGHLNVRDENTAPGILQYRTEAVVRNEIGRNFACVDWIDQQLGRVFDKLEDPNGDGNTSDSVLDNTYIVFTSDHGIAIGRHGLQGKQNLYEHTWKVPFIVRGPGIAAGSETDALVYLHDTFPTFCDLAGIEIPSTIDADDGQSFRAVLEGTSATARPSLYGLYSGGSTPGIRSVTDGRFKLIKYDVDSNATQVTQMFDLETNPFELLPAHGVPNIAQKPAYAAIRQDLEEMLMEQRVMNDDPYAYLGDRILLRFEDGTAGQPAGTLADRFPFENDGTATSGNGSALPIFSANTPNTTDDIVGEANTLSLDFEQDNQNYVQVPDARELDFGDAPFTIEAWVKFESMPTSNNLESIRPVVMKKVIGTTDSALDYMFLAAAGIYGDVTTFNRLAIHLGSGTVVSSLAVPDTGWHHISVALNPVTDIVRFTLDDQVDTQSTSVTGTANSGPLIIGAHFNNSSNVDSAFDGLIDEVSITDGFLPLSEIQPLSAINPVEEFRITSLTLSGGGSSIDLAFQSDDTRLYTIQQSTTLHPGGWTDILSSIPGENAAGETTVVGIPIDSGLSKQFFRVSTTIGL
ncbi:MAG: sulfatase-like hydrolase/transferase [Luteolibacter sp.]